MTTKTLAAARIAHPGSHIEVIDRADSEGNARPALYVWPDEEASLYDDGAKCDAIYWLDTDTEAFGTFGVETEEYQLSAANDGQVIVTALVLDDGSKVADWDFDEQGPWGAYNDDDGRVLANPEPAYPEDDEIISLIAAHLGVDRERVSLGDYDGCDGRLDEAIAAVLIDGKEIDRADNAPYHR